MISFRSFYLRSDCFVLGSAVGPPPRSPPAAAGVTRKEGVARAGARRWLPHAHSTLFDPCKPNQRVSHTSRNIQSTRVDARDAGEDKVFWEEPPSAASHHFGGNCRKGAGWGWWGGGVSAPPKGSAGQPSAPSRQRGSRGLRVGACNVSKAPPSSDSGLAGFFRVKRHQADVTVCLLSHHHFFFFFFC